MNKDFNRKRFYAIQKENEKKILELYPVPQKSGIYILVRYEDGFKYAYIGQAKNILKRLAEHMTGFQHIDNSIRNHRWWSQFNTTGWKIENCLEYPESKLDEMEKYYIRDFANKGFQMLNKTSGGQGEGKTALGETRSPKGYRDGLKQGYENCLKDIREMLKYLDVVPRPDDKGRVGKIVQRKFEEWKEVFFGAEQE